MRTKQTHTQNENFLDNRHNSPMMQIGPCGAAFLKKNPDEFDLLPATP
jgi:hypothetical protein